MSNETSGGGGGPNGPTTTIHWKKWFYIAGAISAVVTALYFGFELLSKVV